jgi:serine protease
MKRFLAVALCAIALPAAAEQISGIIVKLKPSVEKAAMTPASRLARVADGAGIPLQHVRTLATGAQLAALPGPVDATQARATAARIAADPDVEYAEPNWRAHPAAIANDEFFVSQGYLSSGISSISATTAWDTTKGSPNIVVAVIDTGVRPHVDLAGRLLPGYDMVSGLQEANDGNGRDADASDPGDWVSQGESVDGETDCQAHPSSWHGTSVSGIIASVTNDRVWTAGIDWYAKVLPVRVLGKCGGTLADIADGIAWAGGVPVPGVPVNATPAHVLNLSLGGDHACPRAYIDAINAVYTRGFTRAIVAAAGNSSADVGGDAPANCPGVISVASTTSQGNLARYSNFGAVTLSAPGGQLTARFTTEGIVVLSNQGTTAPAADGFDIGGGTSFAAPMVSGTVALMLSVAPNLTPAQVQNILVTTAKPFRTGATCDTTNCGAGIVDTAAAVQAAAALAPPSNVVTVAEYYNATLDHYFITWIDPEQQNLDAGNTPTKWVRTGHAFRAYVAPQAATSPVCRYYIPPALGDSHFFGRGTTECDATGRDHPSFVLEDPAFMHMILPTAGACPPGTVPIYRVFSNRADANHRYMTDRGVRDMMVARGWLAEGDGPDLVVMCAPGN